MNGRPAVAVRWELTAPVASFRDPLFPAVQLGLPFPPPSTVRGLLAAACGDHSRLDSGGQFAYTFTADGFASDLETWHPLLAGGKAADPKPMRREFLTGVHLSVWLLDVDTDRWLQRLRRPVWPLRLGRSQDLPAATRPEPVNLSAQPEAVQGAAVVPADDGVTVDGRRYRVSGAIDPTSRLTSWTACIYDPDPQLRRRTVTAPDGSSNLLVDHDQLVVGWPLASSGHP